MMFLLLMYYLHDNDVRNANFVLSIWILVNIRAEKAQCYVLAKACLKKFESEKNSIDTAGTKRLIFETQIPQICQAKHITTHNRFARRLKFTVICFISGCSAIM